MAGEGERSGSGRSLDALLGEIARSPDVTPPSTLVGKSLGRYRIDGLLGRGGMGIVYRAHDTTLGRDVAIKVLPPELLDDRERRARFVREAKLAARVTHPCVAAVYDAGEHGGVVFAAMELVRGRTLRELLDEGRLDTTDAIRIARDMARGLAKAHELGIVHRDLKPENVMLTDDGEVKILDFGLAKLRGPDGEDPSTVSTELGRIVGTVSYMSPEQAKGKRVDARSDVFSLGVVLYEMVAAKRPFVGETTVEVLIAIDRDEPAPFDKDVSPGLALVIRRCLAKDPDARFASVNDVAEALVRIEGGDGRAGRAAPSRAFAAVVAMLVVGTLAIFGVRSLRDRTQGESGKRSAPHVLAASDASLACPVLEARGVDDPPGWLGAATATIICRRAAWKAGGRTSRTLIPAELLGLPPSPRDDAPVDAYGAPDARARSLDAAKAHTAFVDGSVERTGRGFRVALALHARDGAVLARGETTGSSLAEATIGAMDALGLPQQTIDPEIRIRTGIADATLGLALEDWRLAVHAARPARLEQLRERAGDLGPLWPALRVEDERESGRVLADVAPPRARPFLSSRVRTNDHGACADRRRGRRSARRRAPRSARPNAEGTGSRRARDRRGTCEVQAWRRSERA